MREFEAFENSEQTGGAPSVPPRPAGGFGTFERAQHLEIAGAVRSVEIASTSAEAQIVGQKGSGDLQERLITQFGNLGNYMQQQDDRYGDTEKLALGIYTNSSYGPLNTALRKGEVLDEKNATLDEGLEAAFDRDSSQEPVVKSLRGSHGRSVFRDVDEGETAHDSGYLSTSRDLSVAESFSRPYNNSTISPLVSTIFGRSGLDVSKISIEGYEAETLYEKNTEFKVLLNAQDINGVLRQVLEEVGLDPETGSQERSVDGLDLAGYTKL